MRRLEGKPGTLSEEECQYSIKLDTKDISATEGGSPLSPTKRDSFISRSSALKLLGSRSGELEWPDFPDIRDIKANTRDKLNLRTARLNEWVKESRERGFSKDAIDLQLARKNAGKSIEDVEKLKAYFA